MEQPLLAQSRGPQNKLVPAHHRAQSMNATFPAPPAAGRKAVCQGQAWAVGEGSRAAPSSACCPTTPPPMPPWACRG